MRRAAAVALLVIGSALPLCAQHGGTHGGGGGGFHGGSSGHSAPAFHGSFSSAPQDQRRHRVFPALRDSLPDSRREAFLLISDRRILETTARGPAPTLTAAILEGPIGRPTGRLTDTAVHIGAANGMDRGFTPGMDGGIPIILATVTTAATMRPRFIRIMRMMDIRVMAAMDPPKEMAMATARRATRVQGPISLRMLRRSHRMRLRTGK